MQTDMKRRVFLKGSVASGAVVTAVGAGLLTPQMVLAEWNKAAFESKSVEDVAKNLLGLEGAAEESADINIKAPDIAENGAVVPVTVDVNMEGVATIAIIAKENPSPLAAAFTMGEGGVPFARTNIKMGKTSDIIAMVKTADKTYMAKKEVKVTIGGCGG
jgi:sulfur-oxidizing protein SoxY